MYKFFIIAIALILVIIFLSTSWFQNFWTTTLHGSQLKTYNSIATDTVTSENYELKFLIQSASISQVAFDTINHHLLVFATSSIEEDKNCIWKIDKAGFTIDSISIPEGFEISADGILRSETEYIDWIYTGNKKPILGQKSEIKAFNSLGLDENEVHNHLVAIQLIDEKDENVNLSRNHFIRTQKFSSSFLSWGGVNGSSKQDGYEGISYFELKYMQEALRFKIPDFEASDRYSNSISLFKEPSAGSEVLFLHVEKVQNYLRDATCGIYVVRKKGASDVKPHNKSQLNGFFETSANGTLFTQVSPETPIKLNVNSFIPFSDVAHIKLSDDTEGRRFIHMTFNESGKKKLALMSARNINKPIAILVDGKPILAPIVMAPITGGELDLSGLQEAHAQRISDLIKNSK